MISVDSQALHQTERDLPDSGRRRHSARRRYGAAPAAHGWRPRGCPPAVPANSPATLPDGFRRARRTSPTAGDWQN
ncbi:hypothetical protein BG61_10895 [Caballeronia glathei]|uniref:Uncharacterized protein n=1 Tax=Caballeronia glathei TaxID=60547 RepID=A0A069PAE2_9BURK|nr:hypothetical protein BG61_10895 [Caballeronia glathei]